MNKFVIAIAAVLSVAACSKQVPVEMGTSTTTDNMAPTAVPERANWERLNRNTLRFVDPDNGNICYLFETDGGHDRRFDCVPGDRR